MADTDKSEMAEEAAPASRKPKRIGRLLNAASDYSQKHPWIKNLIFIPAIWAVVSAAATGLLYSGMEVGRYFYDSLPITMPEPFRDDRVGILVARFENDPDGEYSLRVRTALERQFPVAADGSAPVEVDFYPQALTMPARGRLSDNLERAWAQGREWLETQNAELLIWGRAVPAEKELELRILARQSSDSASLGKPELYPLRIPSEFSDQIGAALAGLVAGAGFNAWSQRGEFLTPEKTKSLTAWMARLKTLRQDMPTALDDENRKQIYTKITTAYAQVGAALIADGNTGIAMDVMSAVFPTGDPDEKNTIFDAEPLLFAEILADVVARFSVEAQNVARQDIDDLLKMVDASTAEFQKRHGKGEIDDNSFRYLTGLMCMLAGDLTAQTGDREKAITHYSDGRDKFQKLLQTPVDSQDQLSRARLRSYLGDVELGLAQQLEKSEGESVLASAIGNLGQSLQNVSAETAPRERVRIDFLLATAYYHRWATQFDAKALLNSVDALEEASTILNKHNRGFRAADTRMKAAGLLSVHAYIASGPDSARKSIALIDSFAPPGEQSDPAKQQNANAAHLFASAAYARCSAHLAAAYRAEEKTPTTIADDIRQALESCESGLQVFEEHGDRQSWLNAKLRIADAHTVAGEVGKDAASLKTALAVAEDAGRRMADVSDPAVANQIAGTKGAILRTLGTLENDPARVKEAVTLHRSALDALPENAAAVQRLFSELQLGKTLVELALVENAAGEDMNEGIRLLKTVQAEFSARGATLVAGDATRTLEKAEKHLAKLSTN